MMCGGFGELGGEMVEAPGKLGVHAKIQFLQNGPSVKNPNNNPCLTCLGLPLKMHGRPNDQGGRAKELNKNMNLWTRPHSPK